MLFSIIKPKCLMLAFLIIVSVLGQLEASGAEAEQSSETQSSGWCFGSIVRVFKNIGARMDRSIDESRRMTHQDIDKLNNWLAGRENTETQLENIETDENVAVTADDNSDESLGQTSPIDTSYLSSSDNESAEEIGKTSDSESNESQEKLKKE